MLFLAVPMNTLFVPDAVAKFWPVIVKLYPPPLCPELSERLLTTIL
jgi:hypothetical protein